MRRHHHLFILTLVICVVDNLVFRGPTESRTRTQQDEQQTTRSNRELGIPNFLFAGAQKSGTTYTAHQLLEHPNVCRPVNERNQTKKEIHFLCQKTHNETIYKHWFRHCRNSNSTTKILMDATPMYMIYPERVYRFYKQHGNLQDLKILFLLREPVSREISAYNLLTKRLSRKAKLLDGRISFQMYARAYPMQSIRHPHLLRHRGMYAFWLGKWFQLFRRNQILVLSQSELAEDPETFFQRITTFMGLPDFDAETRRQWKAKTTSTTNTAPRTSSIPCAFQQKLAKAFGPLNEELYQLLEGSPGPPMEKRPFPRFAFECRE